MKFKSIGFSLHFVACETSNLIKNSYRLEKVFEEEDFTEYMELLMYIFAFCSSVKEAEFEKYFTLPEQALRIKKSYKTLFYLEMDFTDKLAVFTDRIEAKDYNYSFFQSKDIEAFCELCLDFMEIFIENSDILFRNI